jgi:transcriptional antiterminator RfaH
MIAWHCCVTRPQQEHIAALHLANQNFRAFLPVLFSKPMFSRYLFVEFDRDKDPWGLIKSTRGCVDLLKDGYMPAIVPTRVIEAIMAYRPPQEPAEGQTEYTKGQTVKITEGVLSGLEGLFQGDVKGRTACLLEICGRKVQVPKSTIRAA